MRIIQKGTLGDICGGLQIPESFSYLDAQEFCDYLNKSAGTEQGSYWYMLAADSPKDEECMEQEEENG